MSGSELESGDDIDVDSSDSENEDESENDEADINEFELIDEECSIKADNVPITPFNMKEELEEGHFDSEGMYHWKKKPAVKDFWADHLDSAPLSNVKPKPVSSENDSSYLDEICNSTEIFKQILCYLQPKETIAQSLRRLGKDSTLTARERWKRKKLGTLVNSDNSDKVTELTGLANKLLTETGDYDIYSKTYEEIAEKVQPSTQTSKTVPTLDMFSDDEDRITTSKDTSTVPLSKVPTLDMFSDDEERITTSKDKSTVPLSKEPTLDMFSDDSEVKETYEGESLPKKPRLEVSIGEEKNDVIVEEVKSSDSS